MSEIITVELDLAKNVFQVHGSDCAGRAVLRKRLRRGQVLESFSKRRVGFYPTTFANAGIMVGWNPTLRIVAAVGCASAHPSFEASQDPG
jgi:hypothetical protein